MSVGRANHHHQRSLPTATTARVVPASTPLYEIANWDGQSQDIVQVLTTAFEAEDYPHCIKNLAAQGIEPLSYINSLNKVRTHLIQMQLTQFVTDWRQIIDILPVGSDLQRRCIRALRKTCGLHGILPTSYVITYPLSNPSTRPFAPGGSFDVWKLTREDDRSAAFAVKALRFYVQDSFVRINKVWDRTSTNYIGD